MGKIPFPAEHEVSRIGLTSDWHSNHQYGVRVMMALSQSSTDVDVHLGDFNMGDNALLKEAQRIYERQGKLLMLVEGNHCNQQFLKSIPIDEDGVRRITQNVWHLPRGFSWKWFDNTFMSLGGAHSVNRQDLVPWKTWWPQERISWEDAHRAVQQGMVDVLLSHDCPAGVDIPGIERYEGLFPKEELVAADTHRALLRAIVDEVCPTRIFHGHYHERYSQFVEAPWGGFEVEGLGCDGDPIRENAIIYDIVADTVQQIGERSD